MRALLAALLAASLVACAAPIPPGVGGVPGFAVTSRAIGPQPGLIEIEVEHRSPGHRVVRVALIGPAGREWLPFEVRQRSLRAAPEAEEAGIGAGLDGGSAGLGAGVHVGNLLAGPPRFQTRALIQVPDPDSYRREPALWRMDISVADSGGRTQVLSYAAPAAKE